MYPELTDASRRALEGLRDLHTLKWYAVPLLALVAYVYARQVLRSRETGNWDPLLAALVVFGCDFFNETWNGWVFHFTKRSAVWTTPGDTAFRMTIGWNLEIIFTFLLLGLVYYHSLLPDRERKILGIPNRWFFALFFAAFCVFIEVLLNLGDLLVWEYPWWNRSFAGIWLIFLLGYFYWFAAVNLMLDMKSLRNKLLFMGGIYAVPVVMNLIALGAGFRY
ncbi:hypothetical protein [Candidatus Solincola tengchongensis]|uniref:hypothetical protein n=1 Tax=Candidatus Solincola tengchongensis TaxID=2900693 RepID=UPI00257D231F|nr:hypothetical protein [Candidatus Solincola tengchongensis]